MPAIKLGDETVREALRAWVKLPGVVAGEPVVGVRVLLMSLVPPVVRVVLVVLVVSTTCTGQVQIE